MDREKVIKALECLKEGSYCECCDYKPHDDCIKRVATDALAMLKEQEAVVRCKDCKHFLAKGILSLCNLHGIFKVGCDCCYDGVKRMDREKVINVN